MTAPVPAPRLSPTAGLINALLRLTIRRLDARIAELDTALAAETARSQQRQGGAS